MSTTKKPKTTYVLAVWPQNGRLHQPELMWGSNDYVNYRDSTGSTWLSLRAISPDRWTNDEIDAWRDIGVYVRFDAEGLAMINLKLHDVHSLNLHQLEYRTKLLRKLINKLTKAGFQLDRFDPCYSLRAPLKRLFAALGITQVVRYQPGAAKDVLEPIEPYLDAIGDALNGRVELMKKARAA